ncbi:MAG: hypothetical protein RE472_03045 [Thermoplasmatales archaeon]|nr:MAG: hypothetical protein RE472_09885 [Thermoplasmatales archaeon]WMT49955.1 MAG: hypothetical protein RE472_03045 [Thermoplasmatales archaeon]
MTKWVTIKKNGKKRAVPLGSPRKGFVKPVSQKELGEMRKIGIKHPGSLTSLGYHISEPAAAKHEALNRAVKKYGRTETLRKLAELYRLDFNKLGMKEEIAQDIKYVSADGSGNLSKPRSNKRTMLKDVYGNDVPRWFENDNSFISRDYDPDKGYYEGTVERSPSRNGKYQWWVLGDGDLIAEGCVNNIAEGKKQVEKYMR